MPGRETYREELLGQLLIITTLLCTSAHLGTPVQHDGQRVCKGDGGVCVCVCICVYMDIFCGCLHVHLVSVWKLHLGTIIYIFFRFARS